MPRKPSRGHDQQISGDVEPGYGAVADRFRQHFADNREVGAACAAFVDGSAVVDLWGGYRDGVRRLPWERDTLVPVFSTTKGMAAMAAALGHSRGWLDFDERVASYWPEFASQGKDRVTVRQLLSHRAGLAALDERLDWDILADPDGLAARLAGQAPLWEPGTQQGYHAWTWGLYTAELVRRADPDGRSIGTVFADEIARPLGVDFHIGLPDAVCDERLATFHGVNPAMGLLHPREAAATMPMLLALLNPRGVTFKAAMTLPLMRDPSNINDRDLLRLELPSVGGVGDARGIARAYGEFATGGGRLGLRAATLACLEAPAEPLPGGRDLVLRSRLPFSLGFGKPFPAFPLGSGERSYAMAGTGGSIGMADPVVGLGFAYTPNLMGFSSPTDRREVELRDALYQCLGGPRQDPRARTGAAA